MVVFTSILNGNIFRMLCLCLAVDFVGGKRDGIVAHPSFSIVEQIAVNCGAKQAKLRHNSAITPPQLLPYTDSVEWYYYTP